MKLHLPQKLIAALCATCTAAAFTLPQVQAEIVWTGGSKDTAGYQRVFYMNDGVIATLTDTDDNQFLITSNVNGATAASGEITSVVTKDGALMRISGGNARGANRILNPLLIDSVRAGDGTGEVYISTEQWSSSMPPENTTVSIKSITGTVGGVDNYAALTLGNENSVISVGGSITNHAGSMTMNGEYRFDISNPFAYTVRDAGYVSWSDETNGQGFKTHYDCSFYMVKGVAEGAGFSISTPEIIKESDGNYYLAVSEVTDYSTFYVNSEYAVLENYSGAGQITVNCSWASLSVRNASFRDSAGGKRLLDVYVEDGGMLETTHSGSIGYISGSLNIYGGGTFRVAGENDAFGWGSSSTHDIILAGSEGNLATLALEQTTNYSVTMTANIAMHGYSAITSKEGTNGFNTYGGNITVDGVENTIAAVELRNAVIIDVEEYGELSVGKFTPWYGGATGAVTKTGAGIMNIMGVSTLPGMLNVNGGTVDIYADSTIASLTIAPEGTLEISAGTTTVNGNSNVIGNTIEIGENGILNLAGTYDISGIESSVDPVFVGGEGIGVGNGFKQVSGTVQVIDIAEGGSFMQEYALFTYGPDSGHLNGDGVFDLSGTPDYTTFYVNEGAEKFSNAKAVADAHGVIVSSVVLASGTSITGDKEGASIDLTLSSDTGTVYAEEATTISDISGWNGNKLIIAGTATVYLLPSQNIDLGANSALVIDTEVSSQKIRLNGTDALLEVKGDGVLATSNNLTLTSGTADVCGTVNVGHDVDLSDGIKSTGTLHIHSGGKVTVKNNMWITSSAVGVLLDEYATYTITGKGVSFSGKEGSGSITASVSDVNYTADNTHAVISNVVMTALGDITIGNTLVESDVVTAAHTVTLSNAASTYGDITVSEGGRLIASADLNISGTLKIAEGADMQAGSINIGDNVSVHSLDGGNVQIGEYANISETEMHGVGGKALLKNMSMKTSANYTIENMTISGSLIDVGEGTTLYLVNVDIKADSHITDDPARVFVQGTHIQLDKTNTWVDQEITAAQDTLLYMCGDTQCAITLAAGSEIVELTSSMFDSVTLTGTDLWLDMTGIAEATHGMDYFTLDFQDFARKMAKAQVDVENLHVYATLDGELYTEAYSTASGGLTTTLYFQVPEPATGTLSLLALALTATRRKRK